MGTTADKLNKLLETKQAIKQAIINKGVEVVDDTVFADYPSKIASIPMEGGDPYYEDFYNLRTSNGTNMAGLFAYCTTSELDLRNLDVSNVIDMSYMFYNCSSSVNIDGWDTSKVTNMNYMFYSFTGSIDVSKLNTSNVTNANNMFYYADTDKIILTGLSFPKCTKLENMFNNTSGTTLDLSSWDISNITSMNNMFSSAKHTRIDLTGWKTTNVTNMSSMFYTYSNSLVELIIPDWDMTNVTNSSSFFGSSASYIQNLKLIDLSRSNDATITKIASLLFARTATTFGTVLVPENTSQEAYDALVAKYWAPIGAAMTPVPTSCNIVAELDEIMPGKSTKVFVDACEPWNADTSKVKLVLQPGTEATMNGNEVISTGTGDIIVEAQLIDTQEIIGTKIIVVSETDSYPNLVKFRAASTPSSSSTVITVNGSAKKLSNLTYDSITDIYSYDASVPITSIGFNSSSNISELVKLNTSNVTDMASMFYNCNKLILLDVSNWDTGNVTSMYSMFYNCQSLTSLDLSTFDTSNVTSIGYMFSSCNNLTTLDLSNFDMTNITSSVYKSNIFSGCNKLHTIRLDNCSYDTINKIITSTGFPTNAIDGVTRTIYCKEENAAGLTPPENWTFSYVTEEEPEVPVDPPAGDIPLYVIGEFMYNPAFTEVRTMVNTSHDDLSDMFFGCNNLVSVNTEDWDTSNVTNMMNMFYHCFSLTSLDLSNWNTSNVNNMYGMFYGCQSLTSLDLSNWDTSSVVDMVNMFRDCSELEELNLSGFSMPLFVNVSNMFTNCNNLRTLHLKGCDEDTAYFLINDASLPTGPSHNGFIYITNELSGLGLIKAPEGWTIEIVD